MTETTEAPPPTEAEPTAAELALVETIKSSLVQVDKGKAKMGDLFAAVLATEDASPVKVVAVPAPTSISDDHRVLLTRLPEVFGKVNPAEVRALTADEMVTIAEERNVLDGLLKLLATRKDGGIREIIANHFDVKARHGGHATDDTATDDKGHFLLPGAEVVGDTGQKFTRELRVTKPSLDGDSLLAAYERGDITRGEYLSCTREVRAYDETKTREAIKKNPMLLVKLRKAMKRGGTTGSIYLR